MLIKILIVLHVLLAHFDERQKAIAPAVIAGILAAGGAIYKMGRGAKQKREAADLMKRFPRPVKTTPKQILENNNLARNEAGLYGLPGQGIIEDKMDADISNAVQALLTSQSDQGSIAQGVAGLNYNKVNATADLGVKAAEYRTQNLSRYMQTNATVAGYEEKNWDWNKKNPYLDAMAAASALRNAGQRNIDSGVNDIAKIGVNYFMNKNSQQGGGGSDSQVGRIPSNNTPTSVPSVKTEIPQTISVPEERKTSEMRLNDDMNEQDKILQDRMYEKALMMNPNLTREQFKKIWVRKY